MNRRPWVAHLLFAALAPLMLATPASAEGPDLNVIDATLLNHPAWESDPAEEMAVVIQLRGPTTIDLYRATPYRVGDVSPQAVRTLDEAFATVAARQAPARAFIESVGATVISTYDTATNGFLVMADRQQVERLTRTPGIERIFRAPEYYPLLGDAVPFIGADAAQALGFTGKDVTIAIVDMGIDYFHKSLGGRGRTKDYNDDDHNVVEPRSFPTNKVIGGWDFAGTNYNAGRGTAPVPDPDPVDEGGHGSHVAGISAGMTGNNRVYHGVAPDAKLIALKIFGRQGSSNLGPNAVEWAIEANLGRRVDGSCQMPRCRVDVMNLSLGAGWSAGIEQYLGVMRRAVDGGIVVIASAGNSGDMVFVTGAPAAVPEVVSVANTYSIGEMGDVVQVTHDGATEDLEALEAAKSLAAQMEDVGELEGELGWFGRGCNGDQPTGDVQEKVALVARGTCPFREKLANAGANGAIAALVYDDGRGIAPWGATPPNAVDFPGYMITQADGQRLQQMLEGGTTVEVRMSKDLNGTFPRDYLADVINASSSRGPSRTGGFKPDISAPGSAILAPRMGTGDQAISLGGTSMSSPMVAGAAAVLIERLRAQGLAPEDAPLNDPGLLTARDVGALLMNYASATVWNLDSRLGEPVPLARQGSGRVNVLASSRGETIVHAGPIASIDFDIQAFSDTYAASETVTIHNISGEEKRYRLTTAFLADDDADAGVTYTPSESELTVAAGGSETVSLEVEAVPTEMGPFPAYGGQAAMVASQVAQAEIDAHLVVTEVDDGGQPVPDGDVARVPIYFLPRAASEISLRPDPLMISPTTGSGPVAATNIGGGPGRAELFALLGEDEIEANVDPRLNVDQVGVRAGSDAQGNRTVEFVVHTTGTRRTPIDSTPYVFVDTNGDGDMNWVITTLLMNTGQQLARLTPVLRQSPLGWSQGGRIDYFAGVDLNSRTIVLPVSAQQIGFAPGQPIALKAVMVHQSNFSDIAGGGGNQMFDFVPNDGVSIGGGGLSVGTGRLEFDQAALTYDFDRWSVALDDGESASLTISRQGSAPLGDDRVLAVFPMNQPLGADTQLLDIVEGEPPTATPTPTATATPRPGPAATIYVPIIHRRSGFEGQ